MWLVVGRDSRGATRPRAAQANRYQEYDRPGRATALSPDDDAAFLRSLKERADAQRRQAETERRAREGDGRSAGPTSPA